MRARVREIDVRKVEGLPPRERPSYTVAEVSHYVGTPAATVQAWVKGQAGFRRVLHLDEERQGPPLLSFLNLVEIHVLGALRSHHRLPLPRIRRALAFLSRRSPRIFIRWRNSTSKPMALASSITRIQARRCHSRRATRDEKNPRGVFGANRPGRQPCPRSPLSVHAPARGVFPSDEPRLVVIDPEIAFGRPALSQSGVPTDVIAERFRAGESIGELSQDYGRPVFEIEEALRCERVASSPSSSSIDLSDGTRSPTLFVRRT